MTSKRELLTRKEQELADLNRIIEVLDELDELSRDMSFVKMIEVAPKATSLLHEVDRLIRKHQDVLPDDLKDIAANFNKAFLLFSDIYKVEVAVKNDINRLVRLEVRKQARAEREAVHITSATCSFEGCKKPVRVYANELAYCKRHAREEGIILRGKIV